MSREENYEKLRLKLDHLSIINDENSLRIKYLEQELELLQTHLDKVKSLRTWRIVVFTQKLYLMFKDIVLFLRPLLNLISTGYTNMENKGGLLSYLYSAPPAKEIDISIIIPTLNAGSEFYFLLKKLKCQKGLRSLEIVIVDSGSTDQTLQIAKHFNSEVIQIPSKDFSHSYSRNLGFDRSSNEYVIFMVQDAYPIGEYWLYELVGRFVRSGCASLSLKEFSRIDADWIYSIDAKFHYEYLGCYDKDRFGKADRTNHETLRRSAQTSNVTSITSRRIFESVRFKGDYAEDLRLGLDLLDMGHALGFLSSIQTIHSHNRGAKYHFKRGFVDVNYLSNSFEDFYIPRIGNSSSMLIIMIQTFKNLEDFFGLVEKQMSFKTEAFFASMGSWFVPGSYYLEYSPDMINTIFEDMDNKIWETAGAEISSIDLDSFNEDCLVFLAHFNSKVRNLQLFLQNSFDIVDNEAICLIENSLYKILAKLCGEFLGFMLNSGEINTKEKTYEVLKEDKHTLIAGV